MDSRVMSSFKFSLQYRAIQDVHLLSWLHFQRGEHTRNQLVLKQCGNRQAEMIVYLQVLRYTSDMLLLCDNNSITT